MRTFRSTYCLLCSTLLLMLTTSCVDVKEYDNSASGNFEALWQIMDEHYCFFPEKEVESGVNWDNIHAEYSGQVNEKMTRSQQFEFLASMLSTLKDGHVNLSSAADYARNWSWKDDYPTNSSPKNCKNNTLAKVPTTKYPLAFPIKYLMTTQDICISALLTMR